MKAVQNTAWIYTECVLLAAFRLIHSVKKDSTVHIVLTHRNWLTDLFLQYIEVILKDIWTEWWIYFLICYTVHFRHTCICYFINQKKKKKKKYPIHNRSEMLILKGKCCWLYLLQFILWQRKSFVPQISTYKSRRSLLASKWSLSSIQIFQFSSIYGWSMPIWPAERAAGKCNKQLIQRDIIYRLDTHPKGLLIQYRCLSCKHTFSHRHRLEIPQVSMDFKCHHHLDQ